METKQIKSWNDWVKLCEDIKKHPEKYGKELRLDDGTVGGYLISSQEEL